MTKKQCRLVEPSFSKMLKGVPFPTKKDRDMACEIMDFMASQGRNVCAPDFIGSNVFLDAQDVSWTVEEVKRVCDQLVEHRFLIFSEEIGIGYYYAMAAAVATPDPARPWFSVTTSLDNRIKSLISACGEAFQPYLSSENITETTLPDSIRKLRKAHVEAVSELSAERKSREHAEWQLADTRTHWEADRANLIATSMNETAAMEKTMLDENQRLQAESRHVSEINGRLHEQLDLVESKLKALDACYQGLFGKKDS
jgi:hypothetical protein